MRLIICLLLALSAPTLAQESIVEGTSIIDGSTMVNSLTSQYVSIFVVNPPSASLDPTFAGNVMTQNAIDGVTVNIRWADIETTAPGTTPCTPAPSDTCQPDPIVPMYHYYAWLPSQGGVYDSLTYPGIWPWFEPFGTPGVPKTVNLVLVGEAVGATNNSTPHYVTDSSWYSLFAPPYAPTSQYAEQDVINSINCSSSDNWTGAQPTMMSYTSPQVMITSTGCCSTSPAPNSNLIQDNDLVWVNVQGNAACGTGSDGAPVTVDSDNEFSYTPLGPSCSSPAASNTNFVSAFQSWPVPYEWPYKSALKALWAATFAHFNPTYSANFGSGNVVVAGQLGYIRPGESADGEAYPYCESNLESLPVPYVYTESLWEGYYSEMLQWGQSQTPYMSFFAPLNSTAAYPDYGTYEAGVAATTSNGHGVIDGFGSQGLSILDTAAFNGCSGSTSDWCDSFGTYYGTGMPRELQQLSLSDEENSMSCPGCGVPPNGNSGDLLVWLPFAVENHMTVLELYTLDAALAFDPNYCTAISSTPPYSCTCRLLS